MQRLLLALLLCPLTVAAQSTLNDLDGDGCVGATDILVILGQYGECNDTTAAFSCGDSVLFDSYWYETVLIGDQCWFAENLRTTVYANGDLIPAGLTDAEWISTAEGASAVYGEGEGSCNHLSPDIDACDEVQSLAEYGRLYNWYAVDDARGLCPNGWHVPDDCEWTSLEDFIRSAGYVNNIGTPLKSTTGWHFQNGTNDYGFSALPAGFRDGEDISFDYSGVTANFWSSSPTGSFAYARYVQNFPEVLGRYFVFLRYGFSVRCLTDD